MSETIINGKNVLITGASAGIGKACAEIFARSQCNLFLIARREKNLLDLKDSLLKQYPSIQIETYTADIRNHEALLSFKEYLDSLNINIDILINNAGLALGLDKVNEALFSDWETMLDTNLKSVLRMIHLFVPDMIASNKGHIINLGSIAGYQAYSGGIVYCATKAAIRSLTSALRKDLLGLNIRVSCVNPGIVDTEFSQVRFKNDLERAEKVYRYTAPLTAEDIARCIFFCANQPSHVNIEEMLVYPTLQTSPTEIAYHQPKEDDLE